MAKVKGPALSLLASGNLGSICYTTWRGTSIARGVWTGTQTSTTPQVTQRAKMTTLSQAWGGTLSESDREEWNQLANTLIWKDAVKNEYRPNGYNLFIQRNMNRLRIGKTMSNTPVAGNGAIDDDYFNLVSKGSGTYVNVHLRQHDLTAITATAWEYWRAGPFDSQGRNAIEPEFRFRNYCQGCLYQSDGGVTVGKWYWYRARWVDKDGRVGVWRVGQVQTV